MTAPCSRLVRVPFAVFTSWEAAINAGYPDAEFGTWQLSPSGTHMVECWIALDWED